MVKAAPATAFVMSKPDLLLELLIVAFDAPAQFGEIDQPIEADVLRQVREPIASRLGLAFRPFDQQPFVRMRRVAPVVIMGGPHPHSGEARMKPIIAAFAPADLAPGLFRQAERERLDRDRLVRAVTAQPGGPPAGSGVRLRRQRLMPGWRHRGGRGNAGYLGYAARAERRAPLGDTALSAGPA